MQANIWPAYFDEIRKLAGMLGTPSLAAPLGFGAKTVREDLPDTKRIAALQQQMAQHPAAQVATSVPKKWTGGGASVPEFQKAYQPGPSPKSILQPGAKSRIEEARKMVARGGHTGAIPAGLSRSTTLPSTVATKVTRIARPKHLGLGKLRRLAAGVLRKAV